MDALPCVPGTVTYYDPDMLRRMLRGTWRGDWQRGAETEQFARELASYFGVGSVACQAMARVVWQRALRALALPAGSEVIMHPFTMADIAGVIASSGLRPVFVDLTPQAYSIDPDAVARAVTARSRVLLVTHLFGLTPDMDRLTAIAQQHNLILIEDASQATGCRWQGRALGSFGRAGFLSLGSLKTCSTLFGGVLLTDDRALAQAVSDAGRNDRPPSRLAFTLFILKFLLYEWLVAPAHYPYLLFPLSRTLHRRWPGLHYRLLGGNYAIIRGEGRIPQRHDLSSDMYFHYTDLQAREGRRRLARLDAMDDERREVVARFCRGLAVEARAGLPCLEVSARHVYWRFPFRVRTRDRLTAFLHDRGFDTTVNYLPLCSELPRFRAGMPELPEARAVRDRTVMLPLHNGMSAATVDRLADAVSEYCRRGEPAR